MLGWNTRMYAELRASYSQILPTVLPRARTTNTQRKHWEVAKGSRSAVACAAQGLSAPNHDIEKQHNKKKYTK